MLAYQNRTPDVTLTNLKDRKNQGIYSILWKTDPKEKGLGVTHFWASTHELFTSILIPITGELYKPHVQTDR